MNCARYRDQFSLYLEGELTADRKAEMENHLKDCAACSAELKAMRKLVAELKGLPQPVVPDGFRQGVWNRINAPAPWARLLGVFDSWFVKLPVGALATAAVALLVINVFHSAGPEMMDMNKSRLEAPASVAGKTDLAEKEHLNVMDAVVEEASRKQGKLKENIGQFRRTMQSSSDKKEGSQRGDFAGSDLFTGREAVMEAEMAKEAVVSAPKPAAPALQPVAEPAKRRTAVPLDGKDDEDDSVRNEVSERQRWPEVDYVCLRSADLPAAEQAVVQFLKEVPVQEVSWPLPTRYSLTMTSEQFDLLIARLKKLGEVEIQQPAFEGRMKADGKKEQPELKRVILDLLPAKTLEKD